MKTISIITIATTVTLLTGCLMPQGNSVSISSSAQPSSSSKECVTLHTEEGVKKGTYCEVEE